MGLLVRVSLITSSFKEISLSSFLCYKQLSRSARCRRMPEDGFSASPPPSPGEATIGSRPLLSFLPSFSRGEEWTRGEARRQWKT